MDELTAFEAHIRAVAYTNAGPERKYLAHQLETELRRRAEVET